MKVHTLSKIRTAFGVLVGVAVVAAGAVPAQAAPAASLSEALRKYPANGYAYKITHVPASGPRAVRFDSALIGVPTMLDVDRNGTADFTGTLGPSPSGLTLNIHRMDGFAATGRVRIEAVIPAPGIPDTYIVAGEDGLTAGTASDWSASVSPTAVHSAQADLTLDLSVSGAPSTLTAVGGMISGTNADAPDYSVGGDVAFTPVPTTFKTRVNMYDGRQQVTVTSPIRTKLVGALEVKGYNGRRQKVDLTIDQLPIGSALVPSIDVVRNSQVGGAKTTYTASDTITSVTGTYTDTTNGVIDATGRIQAGSVPRQLTVDQVDSTTTVNTDGTIGSLDARFALGTSLPAPAAGTGPSVSFRRYSATKLTGGVRLTQLKSMSFNQGKVWGGELAFTTAPTLVSLSAQDDVTGTIMTGSISNLPRTTTVGVDMFQGTVNFNGHGQGIGRIQLTATRSPGTFVAGTLVKRLEVTLDGIAAANTIRFKQLGNGVTLSADQPLANTITLLASDGRLAPAVAGSTLWFEQSTTAFRAFARISGLKSVSFENSPLSGSIDTTAPQLLTLHADTATVDFDGAIDKLPAHVGFSLTSLNGKTVVDYDAQGARIAKITFDVTGVSLPLGANKVHGEIHDMPAHVTVTVPPRTQPVVFDAHGQYVGRVLLQAHRSDLPRGTVKLGSQTLEYDETNHRITADLYDIGKTSIAANTGSMDVSWDISRKPLDYRVNIVGTSTTVLSGTISNPQPARLTVSKSARGVHGEYHVRPSGPNFSGDGSISNITLSANIGGGTLSINELGPIPANLSFCMSNTNNDPSCTIPWVPATSHGLSVKPADFTMRLLPSNLASQVPTQRIRLSGLYCPNQPSKTACAYAPNNNKRIVIESLRFNTVEAAFFHQSASCNTPCGTLWAAFNTNNQPVTATRVAYYKQGSSDELLDIRMPASTDGTCGAGCKAIRAHQKYYWRWYHPAWGSDKVAQSGSFSCIGSPNAMLEVPGWNWDLFSGYLGIC